MKMMTPSTAVASWEDRFPFSFRLAQAPYAAEPPALLMTATSAPSRQRKRIIDVLAPSFSAMRVKAFSTVFTAIPAPEAVKQE